MPNVVPYDPYTELNLNGETNNEGNFPRHDPHRQAVLREEERNREAQVRAAQVRAAQREREERERYAGKSKKKRSTKRTTKKKPKRTLKRKVKRKVMWSLSA